MWCPEISVANSVVQFELIQGGGLVASAQLACINLVIAEVVVQDGAVHITNQSIALHNIAVELNLDLAVDSHGEES